MSLLTDTKARNVKPGDKPIPHGGVAGLVLHPSLTKGHGKWVLRYVSPMTGKRRNAGLGTYPDISILEASKLAAQMRELIKRNEDPLEIKRAEVQQNKILTFKEASYIVHKNLSQAWKNKKHINQWISTLEMYAFERLGQLKLDKITPAIVADTLKPIWLDLPETASRVKQRIHAVLGWAVANGFCVSNPVDVVSHILPTQPSKKSRTEHQPAMAWADIPEFVSKYLQTENRYDISRKMLLLLILTACRSGEIRGMKWEEIDFDMKIWTIPADRMKAKVLHRIPLTHEAIELILSMKGLHDQLVFPSPQKQTIVSDMALTSLLRRVEAKSTSEGRIATAHGFRSSFRDWCSEKGYARDLAERALAHAINNQVEAAYHRTDLLEQRREMMQEWSDFVLRDIRRK